MNIDQVNATLWQLQKQCSASDDDVQDALVRIMRRFGREPDLRINRSYVKSTLRSVTVDRIRRKKTLHLERCNDVPHDVAFAFAFHAFHSDGTWMIGG